MPKLLLAALWVSSLFLAGIIGWWLAENKKEVALKAPSQIAQKIRKYDKYAYENLAKREFAGSEIKFDSVIKDEDEYTSHLISFMSDGKKVTGQVNIPKRPIPDAGHPTVLMLRGWAEQESYKTGNGTRNAAAYFAKKGFLTVAPDFLGYGGSDPINPDVLEARFETYTTVLNLLASLQSIKEANAGQLSIWAHSNGGQIAITILEITGKNIPVTLWAPVTKPFPYSVLVYTDDSDDKGKFLRKVFAEFDEEYDANLYSLDTYLDRINAPIQLHQGTLDLSVRKDWSDTFVKMLKNKDREVKYWVYPGADHNLVPSWNTAVQRDVEFFKKNSN